MKICLLQKCLLNFRIDSKWLRHAPIPFGKRLHYCFEKYVSILFQRREISFLDRPFRYDNRLTPALLPDYLFEVNDLLGKLPPNTVASLLDIGANVGQFAFVVKRLAPHTKIYSFEPNPMIFDLLKHNADPFSDWFTYNFGIGEKDHQQMLFFIPGKSAQGSLFAQNASAGLAEDGLTSIAVELITLDETQLRKHRLPNHFDLVKIDVEGAEISVLNGLSKVSWHYLYFELASLREGGRDLNEALEVVAKCTRKTPRLVWRTEPEGPSGTFQVLLANS